MRTRDEREVYSDGSERPSLVLDSEFRGSQSEPVLSRHVLFGNLQILSASIAPALALSDNAWPSATNYAMHLLRLIVVSLSISFHFKSKSDAYLTTLLCRKMTEVSPMTGGVGKSWCVIFTAASEQVLVSRTILEAKLLLESQRD